MDEIVPLECESLRTYFSSVPLPTREISSESQKKSLLCKFRGSINYNCISPYANRLIFENLPKDALSEVGRSLKEKIFYNLERVTIEGRNFDHVNLDSFLCNISTLSFRYFAIENSAIESIPRSICRLSRICKLSLSQNSFKSFPNDLACLVNLEVLDLSKNNINIWSGINNSTNLVKLNISHNRCFPTPFSLPNLMKLNISFLNIVTQLPFSVNFPSLTTLNISHNELREIPESLFLLTNLQILNLSSNSITRIPQTITKLEMLIELNMGRNKLESVPCSICNCQNLQRLRLERNPLCPLLKYLNEGVFGEGAILFLKYLYMLSSDTPCKSKFVPVIPCCYIKTGEIIHRGSHSVVYKCKLSGSLQLFRDESSTEYVVKKFNISSLDVNSTCPLSVVKFFREIDVMCRVSREYPKIFEQLSCVCIGKDHLWIISKREYCSLHHLINSPYFQSHLEEKLSISLSLAYLLRTLHFKGETKYSVKGRFVHGNLNPNHILVDTNRKDLKLTDISSSSSRKYIVSLKWEDTSVKCLLNEKYTCPGFLKYGYVDSQVSDIYSFGSILIDIFSNNTRDLKLVPWSIRVLANACHSIDLPRIRRPWSDTCVFILFNLCRAWSTDRTKSEFFNEETKISERCENDQIGIYILLGLVGKYGREDDDTYIDCTISKN